MNHQRLNSNFRFVGSPQNNPDSTFPLFENDGSHCGPLELKALEMVLLPVPKAMNVTDFLLFVICSLIPFGWNMMCCFF